MPRFNSRFRQSHLNDYVTCPRLFYYSHIRKIEPESVHASRVIGQASHSVIRDIHEGRISGEADIRRAFLAHFSRERDALSHLNGRLRWDGDPKEALDEAGTYLTIYAGKAQNQGVDIALAEHEWQCMIGTYPFEGRIDQVRRQEGKLILVDFKTSSYRPSEAYLERSYQLSIYAFAVREIFGQAPDEIWQYHLKDHLPYRRSGPWGKAGTERGPAIYKTSRSDAGLDYLAKDVSRICAAIRFGLYFRRPANLGSCNGFCPYTQACAGEMTGPVISPATIHTIEEVLEHEQVA